MRAHEQGKLIYQEKVATITLNTQEWREGGLKPGKGDYFRKIMKYNGGKSIPYCFFTEANDACETLFNKRNVRNYIFYVIRFAVERGKLQETPEGFKCVD